MWGFCPCRNYPWATSETLDIQQVMFLEEKTEQFLLSLKATYFSYLICNTKWGGADTSKNSRWLHQCGSSSPFKMWANHCRFGRFCFVLNSAFFAGTCSHLRDCSSLTLHLRQGRAHHYLLSLTNLNCCSCNQKCKASNSSHQDFLPLLLVSLT